MKTTFGSIKAGQAFLDSSGVRLIKRDLYRAIEPLYGVIFLISNTEPVTAL